MKTSLPGLLKKTAKILAAVLIIFTASFSVADYVLRGHAYFAKRAANFIIRNTWQAVFPPSGPVELYVRVYADQDYRRTRPDWEPHLAVLMDRVKARLGRDFDIHFRILGISPWDRPEELTEYSDILVHAEKNIDRRGTQILILMTGKDDGVSVPPDQWMDVGAAHYLGNCVIVGDDSQLLHELGHLFGTIDYPPEDPRYDLETIYSYQYTDRTENIDPDNAARINRFKYRKFW
ncbi:MAG: hypothetical protein JW843_00945 [Candidatus Aminicenantes bacterium]|nr:hypothetical protein [Candidatus Aminicenantes bacterium]